MGLAWWHPPEPTFEDFFLFLPRKKIVPFFDDFRETIKNCERRLSHSNADVSDFHDLIRARLQGLQQEMADLQTIQEQLFPKNSIWIPIQTNACLPPSFLESLKHLYDAYHELLHRLGE